MSAGLASEKVQRSIEELYTRIGLVAHGSTLEGLVSRIGTSNDTAGLLLATIRLHRAEDRFSEPGLLFGVIVLSLHMFNEGGERES